MPPRNRQQAKAVLRGQRGDVFRSRGSSLELYLEWRDAQWTPAKRNATSLWRRLKMQGFRGSRRVVSEWATRCRRADGADAMLDPHSICPNHRSFANNSRDNLAKSETVIVAATDGCIPLLVAARGRLPCHDSSAERRLDPWINRARDSLVIRERYCRFAGQAVA